MKVINLEENRIVEVTDGYARNYLFPKKLAIVATPVNIKRFEKRIKEKEAEILAQKKIAQDLKQKLEEKELIILAEVGDEGKLFGTVTTQDVVDAVREQHGVELDKKKVNLNEHIKTLGEFSASAKLHHEVTAHITVKVEKKE